MSTRPDQTWNHRFFPMSARSPCSLCPVPWINKFSELFWLKNTDWWLLMVFSCVIGIDLLQLIFVQTDNACGNAPIFGNYVIRKNITQNHEFVSPRHIGKEASHQSSWMASDFIERVDFFMLGRFGDIELRSLSKQMSSDKWRTCDFVWAGHASKTCVCVKDLCLHNHVKLRCKHLAYGIRCCRAVRSAPQSINNDHCTPPH